ncbi:hypothetical protein NP233_g10220 [Leucocoprinus birnbaumii]|uniref:Uncharacterized protein n=1 Tax=Leucocoprinus birnbaumii TaxID=56174 RepID=A0AAD5VIZ1_9AGAR|nr:hypothetical protein NP233_g10220 [Leucocoprinus birnbaumii]
MGTWSVYVHSLGVDHAICLHREHTDPISTGYSRADSFFTVLDGREERGRMLGCGMLEDDGENFGWDGAGDGLDFIAAAEGCAGGVETSDLLVELLDGGSHDLFLLPAPNSRQIPTLYPSHALPTCSVCSGGIAWGYHTSLSNKGLQRRIIRQHWRRKYRSSYPPVLRPPQRDNTTLRDPS